MRAMRVRGRYFDFQWVAGERKENIVEWNSP